MAEAPPEYSDSQDVSILTKDSQVASDNPVVYPPPVMSQPISSQQHHTTVIVNQPQTIMNPGPRMWSSGICACYEEISSCCLGFFCPCCLACQVATDLNESCCVPCCVNGGLVAMRTKLRVQNNIQGSIMDDSSVICCCPTCAVCQMARELDYIRNIQRQQMTPTGYNQC